MTVRNIEVELASLEDEILTDLGYREYVVIVGSTAITPKPEVKQKQLKSYSDTQLKGFVDALGGQGNPIAYFELQVTREIKESVVREFQYWTLTRDGYKATCLPVEFIVEDARYKITLAVIKQEGS